MASDENLIEIDPYPTATKEEAALEDTTVQRAIDNNNSRNDLKNQAVDLVQTWVGFIIVITIAQMILPSFGYGLATSEFIAVVTTTTATIISVWIVIGKGLFSG